MFKDFRFIPEIEKIVHLIEEKKLVPSSSCFSPSFGVEASHIAILNEALNILKQEKIKSETEEEK